MDRRDTLKTLFIGSLAGSAIGVTACKPKPDIDQLSETDKLYGRTPEELERDNLIYDEQFLNEHELATLAVLCDMILPAHDGHGSASDAGVPDFVEFMAKDLPNYQLPLRGGLMWLEGEANRRFNGSFITCTENQRIEVLDDIAYPDPDDNNPEFAYGIKFFDFIRNLTLTGYYTTKMGFDKLGYVGNRPNVWDGVPEEVLKQHNISYDPEWLAKCVDQQNRNIQAEWDENGNLIS